MDYTDGFPWLKWSRHLTGETSVRSETNWTSQFTKYSFNW